MTLDDTGDVGRRARAQVIEAAREARRWRLAARAALGVTTAALVLVLAVTALYPAALAAGVIALVLHGVAHVEGSDARRLAATYAEWCATYDAWVLYHDPRTTTDDREALARAYPRATAGPPPVPPSWEFR